VHSYYITQASGGVSTRTAPPELIEISLMREFHWLPQEIDEIPVGRLQRIFAAMDQEKQCVSAGAETKRQREAARSGSKPNRR